MSQLEKEKRSWAISEHEKTLQILQYNPTSTECIEIWGGETLIGI